MPALVSFLQNVLSKAGYVGTAYLLPQTIVTVLALVLVPYSPQRGWTQLFAGRLFVLISLQSHTFCAACVFNLAFRCLSTNT